MLTALVFYLIFIRGRLSLKFEKEADELAAKYAGKHAMISALEKLAKVNLLPRRTSRLFNLLQAHPSIEERIRYLKSLKQA